MSIYKEEIFGPVLVVLRVKDFNAAIKLANEHQFGNGVAILQIKAPKAREFVHSVEVGMVGINIAIPVRTLLYHLADGKIQFLVHQYLWDGRD